MTQHTTGDNILDASVGVCAIAISGVSSFIAGITPFVAFLTAFIGLIVVCLSAYNQWQIVKKNRGK